MVRFLNLKPDWRPSGSVRSSSGARIKSIMPRTSLLKNNSLRIDDLSCPEYGPLQEGVKVIDLIINKIKKNPWSLFLEMLSENKNAKCIYLQNLFRIGIRYVLFEVFQSWLEEGGCYCKRVSFLGYEKWLKTSGSY